MADTQTSTNKSGIASFEIKVDGQPLSSTVQVSSISISKELNRIATAKLKLLDGNAAEQDFPLSNEETLIPGKSIEILLGYNTQTQVVFKGIIITHANRVSTLGSELHIECRDAAVKMTIGKKSAHYNDITDSNLAEDLIGKYGLTANVEATTVQHAELVQFQLSDWDFLLSRADMMGQFCVVSDGTVSLKKLTKASAKLTLTYGDSILEYQAQMDSRAQYQSVTGSTWDFAAQDVLTETADEPVWTEPGNLSASNLAAVCKLESFDMKHGGYVKSDMLKAWADAKLLRSRYAKITGKVKIQGDSTCLPGDFIELAGVGNRFNGTHLVAKTEHICENGNWTTEIHFGLSEAWFAEHLNPYHPSPSVGSMPAVQGLQIGVVTDLVDPEGEERVRVKLPMVSSSEDGVWARIAALDAGNERGSYFRPEIDDEVIVGFIFNDAAQAVVLGMLHSSAKPAPIAASDDNDQKGFVTRSGIKMLFDDKKGSLNIETPKGKKLSIDDEAGTIQLEDESGNKITMESSGITIQSAKALTLKAGTELSIAAPNISIKADASAEMKGATVALNGSGTTDIKGGLVTIN